MRRPKRSLSQNFLVDPNLQRKIVDALEVPPEEAVLEVGPGHGELTRHLVGRVALVVAVEKDDELARELAERWGGRSDVRLVHGDALEVDLTAPLPPELPYRVLSNVPYGITTPLLFRFLELRPLPERIVVTVQREVGERAAARPGGGAYGSLSVGLQARARVEVAFDVSRNAFRPRPDVDSATLVILPDPERVRLLPEEDLRRLTRAAFRWRRKQLQKILRSAPEFSVDRGRAEELCAEIGADPRARPESLSPEDFVRLARLLGPEGGEGSSQEGREPG